MSRGEPSHGSLQAVGAATLAGVLGLGLLASAIPGLDAPAMTQWIATIPREQGARGLEVGGAVLVDETAAVTLRQCAVFFNRAARGGGAIASLAPDPVLFRGSHQRLAVWASGAWSM